MSDEKCQDCGDDMFFQDDTPSGGTTRGWKHKRGWIPCLSRQVANRDKVIAELRADILQREGFWICDPCGKTFPPNAANHGCECNMCKACFESARAESNGNDE